MRVFVTGHDIAGSDVNDDALIYITDLYHWHLDNPHTHTASV